MISSVFIKMAEPKNICKLFDISNMVLDISGRSSTKNNHDPNLQIISANCGVIYWL
jgi:hypothetical protein